MFNIQLGTSSHFPSLLVGNETNARPAVFFHSSQVFYALEVSHQILSLLLSSLSANLVRVVDVVNAVDFGVLGAGFSVVREDKSK